MLIEIAVALLAIIGLALGGEMTLTSALVKELSRESTVDQRPAAVTPTHAAGIRCSERNGQRRGWRKACIA